MNNSKECEVNIKFIGMSKEQMEHINKATIELSKAGINFDTGGCRGENGIDYDWEFDWSLTGAKVYFRKLKSE